MQKIYLTLNLNGPTGMDVGRPVGSMKFICANI